MNRSVHDNLIVSYEVHCEGREIRLCTEKRDGGEPFERIVIVVRGVEAYYFEHDCLGNILSDIEEVPADDILREQESRFIEGHRAAGWPRFWRNSLEEARGYLRENGTRGFEISSSYGLSGWVLAAEMQMLNPTENEGYHQGS